MKKNERNKLKIIRDDINVIVHVMYILNTFGAEPPTFVPSWGTIIRYIYRKRETYVTSIY